MTAQQPAYISLTEKDGLPDIEFYDIVEDEENYIWVAADKGLYRYNGRNFKHFVNPSQKGNAVFGTKEDNTGRIWCNNISGQFFYTDNQNLKLFIDLGNELNGELSEFIVTDNELIVLPGQNIIRIDLVTKEIKKTYDKDIFTGSIEKTSKGYLFTKGNYITETNSLLDSRDSLEIDVFEDYNLKSGISNRVRIASGKHFNFLYFLKLGENIFYQFDVSKSSYQKIKIPNELKFRKINHSFFYEDDIWFSTDLGVFVCEISKNNLKLKNIYFEKKFVTKVLKDNESNYWIITKGDGIYVIPNMMISQYSLPKDYSNLTKIESVNDSLLVFGTSNGKIGVFNSLSNNFRVIDSSSAYRVSEMTSLPKFNKTLIIKEDLVFELNNKTTNLKKFKGPTEVQGAKGFSRISDTSFVLSSYKRASIINDDFTLNKILVQKRSYTNYFSEYNKSIYIGAVDGFYVFDKSLIGKELTFLDHPIYVNNITETDNNIIWASTFNNGLFGIKQNRIFVHFTTENGLLSKGINDIEYDGNYLWISTNEGVQCLNTITNDFQNLTQQNGIPTYRISDIEVIDNTIYFATNNGMFGILKDKVFKDYKIPQAYITDVSIGLKSVELQDNYNLEYNENSIKISFNANGFQSFINNKYQFRLLGQHEDWKTDVTNANTINYYSLPSGEYKFQVKSIFADEYNEDFIDSVSFIIKKPFWKNWWFYVLVISIISIIVYAIFRFKIKRLKAQQSIELQKEFVNKQLVLSQLENLRSQMNPHFIFNALNSIQEYIVFNEKELASSYLIKFSRLIRIYLDHSRENEISLSEEIDALNIYLELEKNRFEDILNYHIAIDDTLNSKDVKIPSLFIQPYVENALKHGLLHKKTDRELYIHFKQDKNSKMLICSIKDNGIGIDASKKINKNRQPNHKSFATSANERRVALLNTNRKHKIQVDVLSPLPNQQFGTEVLIQIPLKQ